MQRRVISVVKDTWGQGTVYGDEPSTLELKEEPASVVFHKSASLQNENEEFAAEKPSEEIAEMDSADKGYELPYFQSSLFATVLEDTITELRILVECNTEMRISKTMADMGLLLALKYGVSQPAVKDELDGIDPAKLECMEYKLNKLDADRQYFGSVLIDTYKGLSLNKSYVGLAFHVNKILERDKFREFIREDESKNRLTHRDLKKQLRQQRNHIKSVIYDTDQIIDDLKTRVEDAGLTAEIRSRYIENWQRARTEQHTQNIADKEFDPSQTIEFFKQRSDYEQRVHTEVELLVNIAINETLEKIEQWMAKYDKDMENIDLKIQIKKNDYQNQLDTRVGLEETIEKHDTLMKEWIHFKDEREKARQYRDKMTKSAVTVQAWWRGLLVRRQLGPFKVAKKKGDKGKKK